MAKAVSTRITGVVSDNVVIVNNMNSMMIENAKHFAKVNRNIIDCTESIGENNFINMVKLANEKGATESIISNFNMKKESSKGISVINSSEHPASVFFEKGVRPHMVYASFSSVNGYEVSRWLDNKGLSDVYSFVVGGPSSKLRKPGMMFMQKSFDLTWKVTGDFLDYYLNKAVKNF